MHTRFCQTLAIAIPRNFATVSSMKTLLSCLALSTLVAHAAPQYPSLPSKVLATYQLPQINDRSPAAQAKAAQAFLDTLTPKLKKKALLALDDKERQKWTNLPPRGPQGGARLGDLNEKQIQHAMVLLATVLSEQGYLKARNIPLVDDNLLRNGKRFPGYGAEDFWIVIFGTPSATQPWALQFDGHHAAINLTFHGEKMSLSPTFIGTNPGEFQLGGKAIHPISGKAEKAYKLILSLPADLQKKAIVSPKRGRIQTAAKKDGVIPAREGLEVSQLDKKQQALLVSLISEYVADLPKHAATKRLAQLKAEFPKMHFSWSGPIAPKSGISYRIQGPTLIIEYACQNDGDKPFTHVHAMYRDPTNEYGVKTLK